MAETVFPVAVRIAEGAEAHPDLEFGKTGGRS